MSDQSTYQIGEEVHHPRYGVGTVTAGGGVRVVIRFGEQEKTFVPEIAPLTKTGKSNPGVAARRNNGDSGDDDGIEAYRGGALRAEPDEGVRERNRAFKELGDRQGWVACGDAEDEDDGLDEIASEYYQQEAIAKVFASRTQTRTKQLKASQGLR